MPTAIKLTSKAEAKFKKALAQKIGGKARQIVTSLHTRILERTPMNTGRTLGSWYGSAGAAISIDIADVMGSARFIYDPESLPTTNTMSVGSEPGRDYFVQRSLSTTQKIKFEENPFQRFYISNGAKLDSGFMTWFPEGLYSGLPQGSGSRAFVQEYGVVAHYDIAASTADSKIYSFTPRGTLAVHRAIQSVLRDFGR